MKFGLHYLMSVSESQSPSQRYRDTVEQAVRAEGLGFESVWPVEQHFNQIQSRPPVPDAAACGDSVAHHDPAARYGDRAAAPRAPAANRGGDRHARRAQRREGRVRRRPGLSAQALRRFRCPPVREQGPHGRGTRLSARRVHPRPVLLRRPLLPGQRHLPRTQAGAKTPPAHPDRRQQPGLLRTRGQARVPDPRRDPHQPAAEATRASRDLPRRPGRGRDTRPRCPTT